MQYSLNRFIDKYISNMYLRLLRFTLLKNDLNLVLPLGWPLGIEHLELFTTVLY